jgi:hypothetical protein
LRGELQKIKEGVTPLVSRKDALATMKHIEGMLNFLASTSTKQRCGPPGPSRKSATLSTVECVAGL